MKPAFLVAGIVCFAVLSGCVGTTEQPTPGGADSTPTITDSVSTSNGTLVAHRVIENNHTEYLPETDQVRYEGEVRHKELRNESRSTYDSGRATVDFEQWARSECHWTGGESARALIEERVTGDLRLIGVAAEDSTDPITVRRWTEIDSRDGNVTNTPSHSFDRLQEIAPDEVDVTISLDGRIYSCRADVEVRNRTMGTD